MTSVVHLLRGDAARAFESAEKSFEISQEQRFSLYAILSRISRGRAVGDLGRLGEARAEMTLGIEEARRKGIGFMLPMMESWLADIHAKAGENAHALAIVEQTLTNTSDVTGPIMGIRIASPKSANPSNTQPIKDQQSSSLILRSPLKWRVAKAPSP